MTLVPGYGGGGGIAIISGGGIAISSGGVMLLVPGGNAISSTQYLSGLRAG